VLGPGECNDPNAMKCVWLSVFFSRLVPGVASETDAENFVMQNIGVVYGSAIGKPNGTWWYDPKTGQPVQPPEAQVRWARAAQVLGLALYPNGMVSGLVPSLAPSPASPTPATPYTNPDGTPTYDGAPYDPADRFNPYNIAHAPAKPPLVYTPPPPVYAPPVPAYPTAPPPQASYPTTQPTTAGVSGVTTKTLLIGAGILGAIVFAMRRRA
jgi:hypothetical protein